MRRPGMLTTPQAGATIIEFALVAFIMFLIFWGIFEFGRAFYVRNTTQYLTRCIARAGVVYRPSQYEAAKKECFLGSAHDTWPLFDLNPDDPPLIEQFRLAYVTVKDPTNIDCRTGNAACLSEEDVSGGVYDDQATACVTDASRCIYYVQAYYDGGSISTFGILASWLGADRNIAEPSAATTMRAENMGWLPPS
jgi:TadE-like protein